MAGRRRIRNRVETRGMNIIEQLEQEEIARLGKTVPEFAPGDTVIVNVNVVEGDRRRVRAFRKVGAHPREAFTTRRQAGRVRTNEPPRRLVERAAAKAALALKGRLDN